MKSKMMVSVLSVWMLVSLNACGQGPGNPPSRGEGGPRPATYADGTAELAYIDADTGEYRNVKFGLRKDNDEYVGADAISLPADLPEDIFIETDLPNSNRSSWNYVSVVGVDGETPVAALTKDPTLMHDGQREMYTVQLIRVRETFPKGAVSGTFKVLLFDPDSAAITGTVLVNFKKPASTQ